MFINTLSVHCSDMPSTTNVSHLLGYKFFSFNFLIYEKCHVLLSLHTSPQEQWMSICFTAMIFIKECYKYLTWTGWYQDFKSTHKILCFNWIYLIYYPKRVESQLLQNLTKLTITNSLQIKCKRDDPLFKCTLHYVYYTLAGECKWRL